MKNIVMEIIKDKDFEIPADWRAGFSGCPCGLSTWDGNAYLISKWVQMNPEAKFTNFSAPVVRQVAEAKRALRIRTHHRWASEIPVLKAVWEIRRLHLAGISAREVAKVLGLSVPRTEFALSIA